MKTSAAQSKTDNPFEDFYQNPYYLEFKNHFYNYRLRRRRIQRELRTAPPSGLILEIGSGVSTMTEGGAEIIYSDISSSSVRYLKEKHKESHALEMSITEIAMKQGSIATIVCSEVLEHVPDDQAALQELYRVLKPGGRLILTVPAHPYFYSFDDSFVKHERRYAVKSFMAQLKAIGFEEVRLSKVTGFLDKIALWAATRFYAFFLSGKPKKAESRPANSGLMRMVLPFYKAANFIYSALVLAEAKISPLALASVVLITCTKKTSSTQGRLNTV